LVVARGIMTDFYTVLRNALSRVGAADADERDRIYGHVRSVMAQKLRDLDPPLGEAEVEDRLGTFDAAIERIEAEFRERERQVETADAAPGVISAEWSAGEDYQAGPRSGGQERTADGVRNRQGRGEAVVEAERNGSRHRPDMDVPNMDASRVAASAPRGNGSDEENWSAFARQQGPAAGNGAIPDDAPAYWTTAGAEPSTPTSSTPGAEPPAEGWAARLRSGRIFGDAAIPVDDAMEPSIGAEAPHVRRRDSGPDVRPELRVDRDDPIAALARRRRQNGVPGRGPEPSLMATADDAEPYPVEVLPFVEDDADAVPTSRRERRAQAREARAERLNPGRRRIWVLIILLFGAVVVGWAASVFIPILFPQAPAGETADVQTNADPIAANAGAAPVVREAGEAAPALPPAPVAAAPAQAEPIVLFDGTDPGMFDGGPNAVEYQGEGGFVTVTSTVASGGARVTVGPAIAQQIAGHTVRILLEARGTPGQPAGTVRLTYQHGTVGLQTRQAIVSEIFGAAAATWAIPAGADGGNDYLLIEPGVPGDGTAIDIQAIRIVVVN
jgi:hypothetical protein